MTVIPPAAPRLFGRPLPPPEVLVIAALYAIPGVYLVIQALVALPGALDAFRFGELGRAIGTVVVLLALVLVFVGAGMLTIAALLYRADRVGRGLAYVVAADLLLAILVSDARTMSQVVAAIAALMAAGVLGLAPNVQVFLASSPGSRQPTAVVVARVVLAILCFLLAVVALIYLLLGSIAGKYAVLGVLLLGLAGAAWYAYIGLVRPDRQMRVVASAVCGAGILLLLIFGERDTGLLIPLGLLAAAPISLWLPPDARAYFGDSPVDLAWSPAAVAPVSPPPPADAPPAAPAGASGVAAVSLALSFCTRCGSRHGDGDRFCRHCGAPRKEAATGTGS